MDLPLKNQVLSLLHFRLLLLPEYNTENYREPDDSLRLDPAAHAQCLVPLTPYSLLFQMAGYQLLIS